ncbi:porin family protein [Flavobacterium sp.]|uniref:porin family protein n=1 Tax=Flavobacterium sp. TaxID=239 RepID=UPI002622D961|nr:porin family protein [Flavobacterium sp.]
MKKSIVFLFLMSLFTSLSFAQHRQKFGINTGVTYSAFRNMDVPNVDYGYETGILVGLSYEYYLSENLSIKTNLSYDKKSSKGSTHTVVQEFPDPAFTEADINFKFHYNYLTLPVLLKYEFKNTHGFFINGGPFFGYLLDSEFEGSASDGITSQNYTESTTDYNNKFDFGITSGIGKVFQLKNKSSIVVEFRNNLGLFQTNKNNTFNNNTVRSNSYNLLVGWSYDL